MTGDWEKASNEASQAADKDHEDLLNKATKPLPEKLEHGLDVSEADQKRYDEMVAQINKTTDKNEKQLALKKFLAGSTEAFGKVVKVALKAAAVVAIMALCASLAYCKPWPIKMWDDLKANSSVNLGNNIAFGVFQDFVYGDGLVGAKSSLYSYRILHLEAGMAKRPDNAGPMIFTLGTAVYLQPLLKIATIPDKWVLIKQLYVGPFCGYDFHIWRAGIQAHFHFNLPAQSEVTWKK